MQRRNSLTKVVIVCTAAAAITVAAGAANAVLGLFVLPVAYAAADALLS